VTRGFIAAAVGTLLMACSDLSPPTPPLLKGVTAKGGWWLGGCPPSTEAEAVGSKDSESLSPELNDRLNHQFPAASDARQLGRALRDQGFEMISPCRNDASISRAEFRQGGGGFYGPYPIFAQIAWKQDQAHRLIWVKGTVSFTGP
jgi:hypothetical protein